MKTRLIIMVIIALAMSSCKKKKEQCKEYSHERYDYITQIEEVKSFHANNHCCGYHESAPGYNTKLSTGEVYDVKELEQKIKMLEQKASNESCGNDWNYDCEFYE
jgi:hypothetical protein